MAPAVTVEEPGRREWEEGRADPSVQGYE